jgi:MFS family permease
LRVDRRFRLLLTAAGISNLGDGVAQAAMPLVVASLTRDPALVAGAVVASQAPWLLFALVSGAVVDRLDRRRTMIVVDLARGGVIGILGLALLSGPPPIWVIYVAGFLLSTAETLFDPASEAILPEIVGRHGLAAANSRLQGLTWVTNSFIGPPLGAGLFAVVAGLPFLFDAVTFLLAAGLVALIPGSYRTLRAGDTSLRGEIAGGLRFLAYHPILRWTTPMAGATNLAAFAVIAIFVLYVQDILRLDPVGYGVLLSSLGIGGLAGALGAGQIIARIGQSGAIRLATGLGVLATLAFVVATHPIMAALAIATFGFQVTLWNVTVISLRQELVPDALRGRVAGTSRLVTWGTQPIGALAGGLLATAFGLHAPFVFSAAVLLGAATVAFVVITPEAIAVAREDAAVRALATEEA